MAEVKQSLNKTQLVGTISELNFKVETKEVTLDPNGKKVKVTCKTIGKQDFKNPNITVECNIKDDDGNVKTIVVGGNFFQTHEKKLDDKGKVVDNPRFKAIETIMGYTPKETRVKLDGSLTVNEYATEQGDWKSFMQINAFQCSSSGVPEDDYAQGEMTCIIRNIKPEIIKKGDDEEETGRLLMEVYHFDNQGKAYPANLVVAKELADDVNEIWSKGDSVKLEYDITTRTIGGGTKQVKSGGFGSKESKIVSGFTVTEYNVFRGDEPFEEENQYYISAETIKSAMKAREVMIEQLKKEKKEGTNKPTEKKGLGNKASVAKHVEEEVDEDDSDLCPF